MSRYLIDAVEQLALAKGNSLPPAWRGEVQDEGFSRTVTDLGELCIQLGWPAPSAMPGKPRPDQFPLLVFEPTLGWMVAEQWENEFELRVLGGESATIAYSDELAFFDVQFPDPLQGEAAPKAVSIFWRAIARRKHVLVTATLATVAANVLTLGTSLYSMQVFDRVIPLGSFSTLWVLTLGVGIALVIELLLRSTRAMMIEREAAEIDLEISEYFFARSQAIRLDARPPSVGSLASQLRGLESVRALMSSGSLFVIADLPFALFFILVIYMIGGVVAVVPMVSLPLALMLSFAIARMIRTGTDRAQVSGNRKNGMLVESLDAAESIKANRGDWFMLGRWNRLVREVHHYEDPVKRVQAFAGSAFSTLQQMAYVGIMAVGAIEVAKGNMTSGGLLACSIIAGRINGPLLAQMPGLIVQWGYARSSLKALDSIMQLPLDKSSGQGALRPGSLTGPIAVQNLQFAYAGARSGLDIPLLKINPGERVAIVGGIGSGKTTLLRVMAGLYSPAQGTATIAGMDLTQIADDILRRHIGYLPQEVRMVNGTLRDNLLMGLSDVSDDAILDAAKRTGLVHAITAHPQGLELPISEGGRGLSGGQRNLVGMTRMLIARPKVWLLDEPTSNLDPTTEAAVLNSLGASLQPDDTLVFVTHRLQLVSLVKRAIVMANGKIVLDGPSKEVLARFTGAAKAANAAKEASAASGKPQLVATPANAG